MTETILEEKARLVAGASTWKTVASGSDLPALLLADGPHGLRSQGAEGDSLGIGDSLPAVCFPPAVALGSTWNPELIERVGAALGDEAARLGVQVLLGPGMNIKRSPLGGRNFEYFSEDPRLTGELATAMVRGIQSRGVAATPKHFAANNQETDRMRVDVTVSRRALREIYLSAFERVVREAKPWALMSAYNRVNGVFASENRWLLDEVLRGQWGFDGLVMSDWGAVDDPVAAVAAGLDLEMPPSGRHERIVSAVTEGRLDESVLDTAIERLRVLAQRTAAPRALGTVEDAEQVALEAAREAITLLKNDGVLPLEDSSARVLVIGEFARTPRFQGGGSSRVRPTAVTNALDSLRRISGGDVAFSPGFSLSGEADESLADAAVEAARDADVVLAFLGLPDHAESEGFDRTDLALPSDQLALLARLARMEASVVVVLSNGGVVDIASWRDDADAIVEGWLLGQAGGTAMAEVLRGRVSPSGRLAESIPLRLEDTPSHLTFPGRDGQVLYGEDVYVGYRGYDTRDVEVAYPFGFGLSYTTFTYEDLAIEPTGSNSWSVSIRVRNSGARAGAEVAQLYVAADSIAVARPAHELRGFRKVFLEPGKSRTVTWELEPRDFAFWNARFERWQVAPGEYRIEVGASSRDIRLVGAVHSAGDGVRDPLRLDSTLGEWGVHPVSAPLLAQMRAAMPEGAAEKAPELLEMVRSTPVMKLTTWGIGLTEQFVRDVVARADTVSEGDHGE